MFLDIFNSGGLTPIHGIFVLGIVYLLVIASRALSNRGAKGTSEVSPYINTFPPSRRSFADIELATSSDKRPQLNSPNARFTATGFTRKEIEAIGRFPDYSGLSGVPHPKPALNFDISKAVFRPFRPFRWAYHQTMCMCSPLSANDF